MASRQEKQPILDRPEAEVPVTATGATPSQSVLNLVKVGRKKPPL
jgi:hypothetical protein